MTIARIVPHRLAALLGMAALFAAIANAAEDAPPVADPPAGVLLIASAEIRDPRFQRAVVLLLRHDSAGAFGIIINHPLGERPLAAVLSDAAGKGAEADNDSAVEGTIRVFLGGPVQPQLGFVVHSADYRRRQTLNVSDDLAMTASPEVLRDIAQHRGPVKYLLALGYAGWGAGQLEGEVARHGWFTAPAEPGIVFDAERSTVWDKALARREREL
jgi:putative transcriptional regulator